MNPWWRWRLFADKYNNHLLYSMIAMMSCVQAVLVYKWYKGERIKRKWFHAVTGKLYNTLTKSSRPEACKNSFLSIYNSVRLYQKIFSRGESLNIDFRPEGNFAMPMSPEGGGKSNLFFGLQGINCRSWGFPVFLEVNNVWSVHQWPVKVKLKFSVFCNGQGF